MPRRSLRDVLVRAKLSLRAWFGFLRRRDPRLNEGILRHISPKFLEVEGVVMGDAFGPRDDKDPALSWRVRRPPLDTEEGMDAYWRFHSFKLGNKKKGTERECLPAIALFSYRTLLRHGVCLWHDPSPRTDHKGRDDPYFDLHYASELIESQAVRIALANQVLENLIRPKHDPLKDG